MSVARRHEAGQAVPAKAGTPFPGRSCRPGAGRGLILPALALALFFSAGASAQKKDAAPSTLELSGSLADANGPLANKVVRVGPVDSKGNVLNIRGLSGAASGKGLNPEAATDAQGRFVVTVARTLFRGYSDSQAGLSAYTDLGGGRMSSSHQSAVIAIDPKKDKVDAGRVVLPPLKPPSAAR